MNEGIAQAIREKTERDENSSQFESMFALKPLTRVIPVMEFFDEGFYSADTNGLIYLLGKDQFTISYNKAEDKITFESHDKSYKKEVIINKYRLSSYTLTYERVQLLIKRIIIDYYGELLDKPENLIVPTTEHWTMFIHLVSLKMGELDYNLKDGEYPVTGGWY
jgi:hypothetical protein